MVLDLGNIDKHQFEREYFRKKPILIKGGASLLLDTPMDLKTFRNICDRLERKAGNLVFREDGAVFAQNMDKVSDELRARSKRYEEVLSCERVWFDGVHAVAGRGIGCHYDHSDNFVLQQSGTKLWKLAPPSMTAPDEELRLRMIDAPNVGHTFMPDACHNFVVEEGDLLYIPLFWAHWGVSRGTSLSVSLVLNVDSPLDHLLPLMREPLSTKKTWWYPLPMVERATEEAPQELERRLEELLDVFADSNFRRQVVESWWESGYRINDEEREKRKHTEEQANAYERSLEKAPLGRLGLDARKFDRIIEEAEEVDPLTVLEPGRPLEPMLDRLGRQAISSLVEVIEQSYGIFSDSSWWASMIPLLEAFERLEDAQMVEAARRPEMLSWIWRTAESMEFTYLPRFDVFARHLPLLLLGALRERGALAPGQRFQLTPSGPHTIRLFAEGVERRTDAVLGDAVNVRVGESREIELLLPQGGVSLSDGLTPIRRAGHLLFLGDRDAWFVDQIPGGRRFGGRRVDTGLDESGIDAVAGTTEEALKILAARWPEAFEEAQQILSVLLPLEIEDGRPAHASISPFRGVVLIARHDDPAFGLCEELGRTKARNFIDGFDLFDPEVEERVSSPFSGDCSVTRLFEEVFGRVYRRALERRCDHSLSGLPEDAWRTLRSAESITEDARALIEALEKLT